MLQLLRTATMLLLTLTLLTGVVYPLVVTAVAQLIFPHQANGSLLRDGERVVGSEWIGQPFSRPEYFWGRLSATKLVPYNGLASGGSNYGLSHPELAKAAQARLAALRVEGAPEIGIPVDLVTASGSGLDPHISPAAAAFQVPRVARWRRMKEEVVRDLVQQYTEGRQLGVLGEPRVNVLRLNLALDRRQARN